MKHKSLRFIYRTSEEEGQLSAHEPEVLPRVEESFNALSGAKFFSTMDLTIDYNVEAMHEDAIEKLLLQHRLDLTNMYECCSDYAMHLQHFNV